VISVDIPLVGLYNVYNVLAGLTIAKMLGLNKDQLQYAINNLKEIDGRFNLYNINNREIIIDFAHTPDSMNKLLNHISKYTNKNIISVFGCVGYSDKDKRYEMASVVAKHSSLVIVTSDNPGTTSFKEICDDVILGLDGVKYICIEDRETAIKYAYEIMTDNDIMVLMGKGAENFQTIGTERVPYSDKECVLKLSEK
ncbi:MAG: glutamate ligase domain-containing protein, partial [Christensenellales bacterium]